MRTVHITRRRILLAMAAAEKVSDEWQAECLEILLIPSLLNRWRELNPGFPLATITRHPGEPHKGMTPDDNRAVQDWAVFAGYVFSYGLPDCPEYGWNGIGHGRERGYSHSPGSAWNGVTRETVHMFIEALRLTVKGYGHPEHDARLVKAGIKLDD